MPKRSKLTLIDEIKDLTEKLASEENQNTPDCDIDECLEKLKSEKERQIEMKSRRKKK